MIRLGVIKPTFIYRDPRDALLSAYENGKKMSAQGLTNAFTSLKTIEDAIGFMASYVEIAQGWINLPGTLIVKYEDLIKQYDHETTRLVNFLGINPDDKNIAEVIDKYQADRKPQQTAGLHFVKGKIGRHREVFNHKELEICQQVFGEFLEKNDYEI
jgi:hypothetical protein